MVYDEKLTPRLSTALAHKLHTITQVTRSIDSEGRKGVMIIMRACLRTQSIRIQYHLVDSSAALV